MFRCNGGHSGTAYLHRSAIHLRDDFQIALLSTPTNRRLSVEQETYPTLLVIDSYLILDKGTTEKIPCQCFLTILTILLIIKRLHFVVPDTVATIAPIAIVNALFFIPSFQIPIKTARFYNTSTMYKKGRNLEKYLKKLIKNKLVKIHPNQKGWIFSHYINIILSFFHIL